MASIGALLTVYKRPYALAEQLSAIRNQSIPPTQIWCFVQEPSLELSHEIHCAGFDRVIECTPNSFYHFRLAAAMTMPTDFVAVFDDDAIPGSGWFENCLQTFAQTPGILGTHGARLRSLKVYTDRERLGWLQPSAETVEVDYVGQSWFLKPEWIHHLFAERQATGLNGEDIELGARAWRLGGIRSYCPPHPADRPDWWGCRDHRLNADENASSRRAGWFQERLRILQAEHHAGWQPLFQRTSGHPAHPTPQSASVQSVPVQLVNSDHNQIPPRGSKTMQPAPILKGGRVTWAVGMTTAPRDVPTLERSLNSLVAAGWSSPRLFAEPGTEIPVEFEHLPIARRDQVLGAFPNWYLGLAELVMREPQADAYLMCQDDVLFAAGLRKYLDESLWLNPQAGVISVYCPSHYATDRDPGFHAENRGWQSWGALAYVLPAASARALLGDGKVLEHRLNGPADGLRNIDSVVGRWCLDTGRTYLVHVPSLAQHIGDTSTIWTGARNAQRRHADRFLERVDPAALAAATASNDIGDPQSSDQDDPSRFSGQAWRFIAALTRHAADGLRKCSQEQVNERLAICQNCPEFAGDRCGECGCHCNERRVFLNKLAWHSEVCPLGKW
ncbi:MAG: hypothetical protein V4719_07810 [Planctomycetota bacterium]